MADFEHHLTESERKLIKDQDPIARARALADVARIGAHFGVSDDTLSLIVSAARDELATEEKPDKAARRAKKALRFIEKFVLPVDYQKPGPPVDVALESRAVEPVVEETEVVIEPPEALAVDTVEDQAVQQVELAPSISASGRKFLVDGLGAEWWKELGIADESEATIEAVVDRITQNAIIRKPSTVERLRTMFTSYLQGHSANRIAVDLGLTGGISLLLNRVRDQRQWQQETNAHPQEQTVTPVVTLPQPIPKPPTIELKTAQDVLREKQDQANELGARVKKQWSDILDLDEDGQWALDSLLSFDTFDEINPLERSLVHRIVNFVDDHYPVETGSVLEHPSLDLDENQRMYLRRFTGRWYTRGDQDMQRKPTHIINLSSRRAETSLTEIASSIYTALEQLGTRYKNTTDTTA